ncbi:MAG TPA: hypothetical protein VIF62_38490 [Labilithrix sp.]|jgi:hypothetical protein
MVQRRKSAGFAASTHVLVEDRRPRSRAIALTTILAFAAPRPAFAEESPPIQLVRPAQDPLDTRIAIARSLATPAGLAAPEPREIRLSNGAKTAIIVTAIVVGALIILVAVSAHHHGPFD